MPNIGLLLQKADVIVPPDGTESMRIVFVDVEEEYVIVTGEESGDEYTMQFNEVDLNSMFYELKLIPLEDYTNV